MVRKILQTWELSIVAWANFGCWAVCVDLIFAFASYEATTLRAACESDSELICTATWPVFPLHLCSIKAGDLSGVGGAYKIGSVGYGTAVWCLDDSSRSFQACLISIILIFTRIACKETCSGPARSFKKFLYCASACKFEFPASTSRTFSMSVIFTFTWLFSLVKNANWASWSFYFEHHYFQSQSEVIHGEIQYLTETLGRSGYVMKVSVW